MDGVHGVLMKAPEDEVLEVLPLDEVEPELEDEVVVVEDVLPAYR